MTKSLPVKADEAETVSTGELARLCGISQSYASMILRGQRVPKLPLALRIWKETGHKTGPLVEKSDSDCELLHRLTADIAA